LLITEEYRQQNKALHEDNAAYGTSGHKYADAIRSLCAAVGSHDILDYGCGKGTLGQALKLRISEYDPCIKGKDDAPEPADVVVCTDVAEHLELDCLDDVLADLARVTNRVLFMTICVVPARKVLPDGRNAHILLRPMHWWAERLSDYFEWVSYQNEGGTFIAVLRPKA